MRPIEMYLIVLDHNTFPYLPIVRDIISHIHDSATNIYPELDLKPECVDDLFLAEDHAVICELCNLLKTAKKTLYVGFPQTLSYIEGVLDGDTDTDRNKIDKELERSMFL